MGNAQKQARCRLCSVRDHECGSGWARTDSLDGFRVGELVLVQPFDRDRTFLCRLGPLRAGMPFAAESGKPRTEDQSQRQRDRLSTVHADLTFSLETSRSYQANLSTQSGSGSLVLGLNPAENKATNGAASRLSTATRAKFVTIQQCGALEEDFVCMLAKRVVRSLGFIPETSRDASCWDGAIHSQDGAVLAKVRFDPPPPVVIDGSTEWKVQKRKVDVFSSVHPNVQNTRRASLVYRAVQELLTQKREVMQIHNARPVRGLLLSGPPGVGKTSGVQRACADAGVPMFGVRPDTMSFGGTARVVRNCFAKARALGVTAVIFLDEIDAICPTRDSITAGMNDSSEEIKTVAQLLSLMDGCNNAKDNVFVIGATNRPNAIDPALRRPGRFDREVTVLIPDCEERQSILQELEPKLDESARIAIALETAGFVYPDLDLLCVTARRIDSGAEREEPEDILSSFRRARRVVGPSVLRHAYSAEVPQTTWEDVAGSDAAKKRLQMLAVLPFRNLAGYKRLGLRTVRGILLHGPPGCAKTTLVKACAAASGAAFIRMSGADVYSCYLGEAERILRATFNAARVAAPCILFLDELDSIVGSRSQKQSGEGNSVKDRVLSTLLTELDGVAQAHGVLVLGATNRLSALDTALLRPGRFDEIIEVGLPSREEVIEILRVHTRRLPVDDVNLGTVADLIGPGKSGADVAFACQSGALTAMREDMSRGEDTRQKVELRHFRAVICSEASP